MRCRLLHGVILALVAVLGTGTALLLPPGHGPDEPSVQQYARYLAETGSLPDPTRVDVVQAQHPPLYYAGLALLIRLLPDFGDAGVPARPVGLAYERPVRIAFDQDHPGVLDAAVKARRAARGEMPPVRYPYALRLAGVLLGAAAAAAVLGGARRACPDRPAEATLAAAVMVLVPLFAVLFATPVNDQPVVLFGTIALALQAGAPESLRRRIAASALFGLAFLSKTLAIGPFAAGVVLAFGLGGGSAGARLRRVLVLALGPLLIAGWWYVRQVARTGSPVAVAVTALRHPGFIRSDAPDAWELTQVLGGFSRSFLGVVGGLEGITPGELWLAAAMVLPPLVVVAAAALAAGRRVPRRERVLGVAALAGFATTLAVLLYGTRWFVVAEGRYLHALALPAAWSLAAGLPRVLGARARPLLGALAAWMALGGLLLLHLGILPRYHADLDVAGVAGFVQHLDLGTDAARPAVLAGRTQPYRGIRVHDADRRMATAPGDGDAGIAVRLGPLDPRDLHLVSVRIFPPLPTYESGVRSLSHVVFAAGARPLGGSLSAHACAGRWIHLALPPGGKAEAVLEARGFGALIGVSEVLVRRLSLRLGAARVEGEDVVVKVLPGEPGLALPLAIGLAGAPGTLRALEDLAGAPALRWPLPQEGTGPLSLEIEGPEVLAAHLKAVTAVAPATAAAGAFDLDRDLKVALGAPGLYVMRLDPAAHAGCDVLELGPVHLPPAALRLRFLDDAGRPVPAGMLAWRRNDGLVPIGSAGLELPPAPAGSAREPLRIAFTGKEPLLLDRVLVSARLRWQFPLGIGR